MKRIRNESIGYRTFRTAFLIVFIVLFLFPLFWMVRTSVFPRTEVLTYPPHYIPKVFDFSAYPRIFGSMNGTVVIINTVRVNIIAALLALALGIPAAYAVSRFEFKAKESGFMFTALSTRFLPPATALVPIYFLYVKLGLVNNLTGLVIAYAGLNLPIVIWVMRSFIDEIPKAMEQSYMLDGHSRIGAFFKIILPLSLPGIAAMFMICNFLTWGEFLMSAVLTTSVTAQTIPIAVAQLDKQEQYLKEIVTQSIPLGNDGKPVASVLAVSPSIIPKGAKNVAAAKQLLADFIKPDNLNAYLKETRARYLPVMMRNIKEDPYWTDPNDPHRPVAVQTGLVLPTIPYWMCYNPAYAQVLSEQLWSQAEANITQKNMSVEQATDEAAARMKVIFENFKIG